MFEFIKSLFQNTNQILHTGLQVIEPRLTDWNKNETGIISGVNLPTGDWSPYAPTGKEQWTTAGFDSESCATFSALNILPTMIKQMLPTMPKAQFDYFRKFEFIDPNGNVNISDNFTAVMDGTTATGNNFPNVHDSIRRDGVIPEQDFPFTATTLAEWLDPSRVTPVMKNRAKKFLQYFTWQYQWVFFNTTGAPNTAEEIADMQTALLESPLQVGITIPAYHAEELMAYGNGQNTFFNSYEPFIMQFPADQDPMQFAMKFALIPTPNAPAFPTTVTSFVSHLAIGSSGIEVKGLQDLLCYLGFMNISTGYFGVLTQQSVKDFQGYYGIDQLGEVGPATRAKLNEILSK